MKHKLFARALTALSLLVISCASTAPKIAQDSAPPSKNLCKPVSPENAPQFLWSAGDMSNPESVVYEPVSKTFLVSNVSGNPLDKDGKGWISQIDQKGKMVKARWADGTNATAKELASPLNAPKGMALRNGVLWVTDIDEVVGFEVSHAKKTVAVKVADAKFLNDITMSNTGSDIFVSDMMTNRIHSVKKSGQSITVEGPALESPNGVKSNGKNLMVVTWGKEMQANFTTKQPGHIMFYDPKTKTLKPWIEAGLGNLDGLELDGNDAVLVTDWIAGKVYRVKKNGDCLTLLEGFKGSADITFLPGTRTLVIPLMMEDKVVAYKLPNYR